MLCGTFLIGRVDTNKKNAATLSLDGMVLNGVMPTELTPTAGIVSCLFFWSCSFVCLCGLKGVMPLSLLPTLASKVLSHFSHTLTNISAHILSLLYISTV